LRRVVLATGLSLVVLAAGVVVAGYLAVGHYASSIRRISGIMALDSAHQPVMPVRSRRSMTVLLTLSGVTPGRSGVQSGLIALVHLDADDRTGAVISIPASSLVRVPGHGTTQLWNALRFGGPSLLIETVEELTNVRIDHYSVMNFQGARSLIGAMGGVNVDVPFAFTSDGYTFPAGIDHLTAASVLPYLRQPGVSVAIRAELQGNLIRAMLDKAAADRMFVATDFRVLRAMVATLSVDSNFSDTQLESVALRLGYLPGHGGVFITAPTTGGPGNTAFLIEQVTGQLWEAIRKDSIAEFARQFPYAVTPGAPA
jgi:LCP family protein required for cell wall assembly